MRSNTRPLNPAIALILCIASPALATGSELAGNFAARLDALFNDLHTRGLFDGAVVVGKDRTVVWQKGFGYADAGRRIPFTPDTPSDGASLAKTLTAAVVIMLSNDGALDLDAPVQRLLPELPYPQITLRHLLTHSSGVPVLDYDYFDPFLPPGRIRTTEALLDVIAAQKPPLLFVPGTGFEYSSFGYDLAALAAARAAHKPLADLLRDRIFAPLGISSAFLRPARLSDFPGIRTLAYRRVGGRLQRNEVFDFEAFHGGSNIYISTRDLHRWNASLLDDKSDVARIGGGQSALTLGNWYRSPDGEAFSYAGHLAGFHSEVFRNARSRSSIVYVSNNTLDAWLQHGIIRAANAILEGRSFEPLTTPPVDEIRKDEWNSLAGRWVLSDGEVVTIEPARKRMSIWSRGVSYRMVQVDPRAFYVPGLDYDIGFAKKTRRIYVSTNFGERWGDRAP